MGAGNKYGAVSNVNSDSNNTSVEFNTPIWLSEEPQLYSYMQQVWSYNEEENTKPKATTVIKAKKIIYKLNTDIAT